MRITIATMITIAAATAALAEGLPYPKGAGQCSGSYVQSGSYCVPKSERSAPAVPKLGQCPAGWRQSGGACERAR
jgi:hypothetical protein